MSRPAASGSPSSGTPAADAPRQSAPSRGALVTAGIALTIVAALAFCEAWGWPFLVGPLQRSLAAATERRIVLDGDGAQDGKPVRIGLLGGVSVQAPTVEIGAPSWSQAPHMALARNARIRLGYGDLWRAYRGGALHIRELRADELDARIERLADGRASWQFGARKPAGEESGGAKFPTFTDLRIGDGTLGYADAVLDLYFDSTLSLRDASAAAPVAAASEAASRVRGDTPAAAVSPGLQFHAQGKYKKMPLEVELSTSGVLDLAGGNAEKVVQPVRLQARIGAARLAFEGVAADPLHLTGLRGKFELQGSSLAAVGDPLGLTLPTTGPFKTQGDLVKDGVVWKADFGETTIGESRLQGSFVFDPTPAVPLLSGRLGGSRLLLADLGPAVGVPPQAASAPAATPRAKSAQAAAKTRKVLPDRSFDLPSLRAMNADVSVNIAHVDLGTPLLEALRPLQGHLRLQDGVLTLTGLDARTADGRLTGSLQLDGRKAQALWSADVRVLGVRLERWLRQKRGDKAPPYISGRLDGAAKVSGQGKSTADILGSLDGSLRLHVRNAAISHLIVEAVGIDAAQALGVMVRGDQALLVHCNVADFVIENGVARPRVFIIDTQDSTIWVDGTVSLKSEALDLRVVVSPKDFSLLSLRTPIHVRGTLSDPSVSLEAGRLAGKAGAAVLLSLLTPLAAVLPFIDTGDSDEAKREAAKCAELAKRGNLPRAPASKPAGR